jgi:RNA polymerase-binding transcription factor DksA
MEMVRRRQRHVDTAANVPVGAPTPSSVRELLLTLRTRLEAQLKGNGAGDTTSSKGIASMVGLTDMADTAADVHDTVVERAVQGNITRQLEQVNETLMRIDAGQYGICPNCLKPIAADRLVVRPFSTLCIDCQNQLDRGKRARF